LTSLTIGPRTLLSRHALVHHSGGRWSGLCGSTHVSGDKVQLSRDPTRKSDSRKRTSTVSTDDSICNLVPHFRTALAVISGVRLPVPIDFLVSPSSPLPAHVFLV
jgi:hypothetical protein